jgi:allophanate hydrolase subunit 2
VTLRAMVGPRAGWLASLDSLTATVWTVSEHSDRVGVRLVGPGLERHPSTRAAELPSEGVVRGAVQVPPGGQPVVFLSDHPVTGGYPVVAVVVEADIDLAAQVVPGQELLFRLQRG